MNDQDKPNGEVPEGMQAVPINDLDAFITRLVHWHNGAKARVQHATQMPSDGSITLEYDGLEHKMEGAIHTGFMMGLAYCYAELGTLPFGYTEVPDEPDAS